MQQLDARMKAGAGNLQQLLSQGLAEALKEGNASARLHCLQAFAAIGDASGAEEVQHRSGPAETQLLSRHSATAL